MSIGATELLLLVAVGGFALALVVAIARNVAKPESADEWAAQHGIGLTEVTRPMVLHYLTRSRRFRLAGALIGLVIPFGTNLPGFEVMIGYLIGALIAEFTQKRLADGDTRSASLVPRSLSDYLPRYVPMALRSAALLATTYLALYFLSRFGIGVPTEIWVGASATIVLPLVVEYLLRRMVARPQPAASAELVAVDDALRASSIHAAAGAGLGASLLMLAVMTWIAGSFAYPPVAQWAFYVLAAAMAVSAIVMWLRLGPATPWNVQRGAAETSA
jgi:hypothetical protein